jgi:hypothetical protein
MTLGFPKPNYKSRSKYKAIQSNGFGSKLESAVYALLKLREMQGEIKDIRSQVPIVLQDGPREEKITWKVDFSFINVKTDQLWYCEAKGVKTETYKIKLKLFRKLKPGPLEIWGGDYRRPTLLERIEP